MTGACICDSQSEEVQEKWTALESLRGSRSGVTSLSGRLRLRETPRDRHAALNETNYLNQYREK